MNTSHMNRQIVRQFFSKTDMLLAVVRCFKTILQLYRCESLQEAYISASIKCGHELPIRTFSIELFVHIKTDDIFIIFRGVISEIDIQFFEVLNCYEIILMLVSLL